MRTSLLKAFVAVLLLSGCGWFGAQSSKGGVDDPIRVERGDPFWLQVGQSAVTPDGAMLTFVSVVDDSRCPEDVTCVWGGMARVVVVPSEPHARYRVPDTLAVGDVRAPEHQHIGPFRALDLQPYPHTERPKPDAQRYRAQFVIE